MTRSWWRAGPRGGEAARQDLGVKRVVVGAKLVLREQSSLESRRLGDVARGAVVLVVDEDLVDGVVRCKIGSDSTPRGVAVHNMGWVTAAREGELKLSPVPADRNFGALSSTDPSSPSLVAGATGATGATDKGGGTGGADTKPALPWSLRLQQKLEEQAQLDPSFSRLSSPLSPTGDMGTESMASRIARRRQDLAKERHDKKRSKATPRTAPSAAPAAGSFAGAGSSIDAEAGAGDGTTTGKRRDSKDKKEEKFEMASSAELDAISAAQLAEATARETSAQARHDTVEAQLGRLLHQKKIKLEDLMLEWDRNKDGDISKQEFRLHTKKLGLDQTHSTADIDSLYDSLDLDGSGSLDVSEMKAALKRMQEDVKNVNDSMKRIYAHAKAMRAVAELFTQAAKDMLVVENAKQRLETLREATSDTSAAYRVAETIKKRNLKIGDILVGWDPNGRGVGLSAFCKGFLELGAKVPTHAPSRPSPTHHRTLMACTRSQWSVRILSPTLYNMNRPSACTVRAMQVSNDELEEIFVKLDVDRSGVLEKEEVAKLLSMAAAPTSVYSHHKHKHRLQLFPSCLNAHALYIPNLRAFMVCVLQICPRRPGRQKGGANGDETRHECKGGRGGLAASREGRAGGGGGGGEEGGGGGAGGQEQGRGAAGEEGGRRAGEEEDEARQHQEPSQVHAARRRKPLARRAGVARE